MWFQSCGMMSKPASTPSRRARSSSSRVCAMARGGAPDLGWMCEVCSRAPAPRAVATASAKPRSSWTSRLRTRAA